MGIHIWVHTTCKIPVFILHTALSESKATKKFVDLQPFLKIVMGLGDPNYKYKMSLLFSVMPFHYNEKIADIVKTTNVEVNFTNVFLHSFVN
jgi:hypothetical protein